MKRLVICCDGTWNEPDQKAGGAACPTNVVKLAALVPPLDGEIEQRVLYNPGIGSESTRLRRYIEGSTGLGITRALKDCYRWLVRNYQPGDELYFFGFSRGAYTARSLAGFVRNSGILKPQYEDLIPRALGLYRSRGEASGPRKSTSRLFRQSYAWGETTPIRCVGVWDTVGSLGVPNTIIQGALKHLFRINREFHDTDLSSTVAYAFHAVSIDERRKPFLPTLWSQTDKGRAAGQHLEQVWFPGCHADVGGGNECSRLADVALGWMIDRARTAGLALQPPEMLGTFDFPAFNPDPLGPVHESMTLFYRLFGSGVRTIAEAGKLGHESVASDAWSRWAALADWRPAALVDYLRRYPESGGS
jgi:uncharacterized protein (DUF2235 family)